MDDIRVTYSGLLGFAVAMGGMLAGLAFIIIVTRQLEPEEFGAWAIIYRRIKVRDHSSGKPGIGHLI